MPEAIVRFGDAEKHTAADENADERCLPSGVGDQTEETAEVQTLELAHETAETHETLAPGEPSEDVPITEILDEQPTVDPTNEAPPEEHAQDDEIPKPPVDEPAIDGESTAQSATRESGLVPLAVQTGISEVCRKGLRALVPKMLIAFALVWFDRACRKYMLLTRP